MGPVLGSAVESTVFGRGKSRLTVSNCRMASVYLRANREQARAGECPRPRSRLLDKENELMHGLANAMIAASRPGALREAPIPRPSILSERAGTEVGTNSLFDDVFCRRAGSRACGQRPPRNDVHLKMWSRSRIGVRRWAQTLSAFCRRFATAW